MTARPYLLALTGLLAAPVVALAQPATLHYDLQLSIDPAAHLLDASVRVTFPPAEGTEAAARRFLLHEGLVVSAKDPAVRLDSLPGTPDPADLGIARLGEPGQVEVPLHAYQVSWSGPAPAGPRILDLRLEGAIHHPVQAEPEEYARSFSSTPGIVSPEGVYLAGSSWWLPRFGDGLASFRIDLDLPAGWQAVSQGVREKAEPRAGRSRSIWTSPEPQEEVVLVAAPFVEYTRPAGPVEAQVYLRQADPALASRYLEATAQYIDMYARLLGPYPYRKFALVENFWETGYGMPSFTLLGPKVIRFPFILASSYPHEILHNWWGNSVFVDETGGNWCEGLTAYLADHLFKEGRGEGAEYRRDALKRFADHVSAGRDFPLVEFRSRHSPASEAIGYGKALLVWHMLRQRIGDPRFIEGLARFYRENRFRRATFADLERTFSAVSGQDMKPFFRQWLERPGAPELVLEDVRVEAGAGGSTRLSVVVRQVQPGERYTLAVPVVVTLPGEEPARRFSLHVGGERGTLETALPAPPLEVAVDPEFDLFRRLDGREAPPTLSALFGAERLTFVLPAADPVPIERWEGLAQHWSAGGKADVTVVREDALESIPEDRAVWVLGRSNRWARALETELSPLRAGAGGAQASFGGSAEPVPAAGHSFVYVVRHPGRKELAIGWIGSDVPEAIAGLARKLPHYGKYSYLAFAGSEPTNVRKGEWPVAGSPLRWRAPGAAAAPLGLPGREPLARPAPPFDAARLLAHVARLSGEEMEGRGAGSEGLERAGEYLAREFAEAGLEPGGGGGGFFQSWIEEHGPGGEPVTLRNVVGVLRGQRTEWAAQSVVIGAHYDHLGRGWPEARASEQGLVHPGADDNASGVAVLIELARSLSGSYRPPRSIVFVAFAGEEWGLRGSRHYIAAMTGWPAREALAMINLDTVGRLGAGPLQVLGAGSADEWPHIARGIGFTTGIASKVVAEDPGGSDQKSFAAAGVPAVQIFAGAHEDYHRSSDTADKVDGEGLVKVSTFTREALTYLAERDRALTRPAGAAGAVAGAPATAPAAGGRRASLGTLPDFAFAGPGVRIEQVMAGTPAERAGLAAGDVIVAIDGAELRDLAAYSAALKAHAPGDQIEIKLRRGADLLTVAATLAER